MATLGSIVCDHCIVLLELKAHIAQGKFCEKDRAFFHLVLAELHSLGLTLIIAVGNGDALAESHAECGVEHALLLTAQQES